MYAETGVGKSKQNIESRTGKLRMNWKRGAAIIIGMVLIVITSLIALPAVRSEKTLDHYWVAEAARYQAVAAAFTAPEKGLEQSWSATAARYQALADAYLAKEALGIQKGWAASAARYTALAECYTNTDQ